MNVAFFQMNVAFFQMNVAFFQMNVAARIRDDRTAIAGSARAFAYGPFTGRGRDGDVRVM